MKLSLALIVCAMFLYACEKERVCECKNAYSTYDAGQLKTTKSQAKKSCKELSTADTDCYLKK